MRVGPAQLWPDVAPQWILNLPQWLEDIFYKMYKCFIFDERYTMFAKGLGNTLLLTALALILGVILGVVVSLVRVTWDKNGSEMHGPAKWILGIANVISKIYITVIRGTPVVVQLLIMYFVIFASSRNKIVVGALSFGINSGAYVAEIIRGGLMSVDKGQMEAGRSLGLSYCQSMRFVILPQAFKNVLPALGNEFIVLIKETSIVSFIAVTDLYKSFKQLGDPTYDYTMPYLMLALTYLVLVLLISWGVRVLEAKMKKSER